MAMIGDYDGYSNIPGYAMNPNIASPGNEFGLVATQLLDSPKATVSVDLDRDGVIDILDTRPLDSGGTIIQPGNQNSDSIQSEESGVITISIQDILILLAISSAVTITFLWRAKKKESNKAMEKEA